jgi:hypothetical protein
MLPLVRRPLPVTIIGFLFIAAGAVGLLYHLKDGFSYENVWVALVRAIAVVCGIYLLRGRNWARLLAMAWIGYHVILSAFHSAFETAAHGVIAAALAYFLFRRAA